MLVIYKIILRKLNRVKEVSLDISKDNSLIKKHLRFINSEFSVVSDINPINYEPSVVLILKKSGNDIIKTYNFTHEILEDVYEILERFGRENNIIDKPRNFPSPKFRY